MIARLSSAALAATIGFVLLGSQKAEACGCFAPPDPTVPIVQAGERILFSVKDQVVTAHIQIQYAGEARDFGWLLPLPSVPTMKLGTEELFTQLIAATQPRYFLNTITTGSCSQPFGRGVFAPTAAGSVNDSAESGGGQGQSVLVTQASIGPYDYAVLRADNKDAMLQWLNDNHYFIPAGTDETVGPYIRPGAYFLALKLQSGKSAGDIQPVVLEYPSELPMIPIILTSVAAQPNMGIQVWMLGEGRAIPRNYNHVVLNDSEIDWLNRAQNYNDVVIKAVSEAPEKHAFVTEYAGTSKIMDDVLDAPGRFGTQAELAAITDPVAFVAYLFDHGFVTQQQNNFNFFQPQLTPLAKSLVLAQIPLPTSLANVTNEDSWLNQLSYYLGDYRNRNPEKFVGYEMSFDPGALAAQLHEKVVKPAREAGALFDQHPFLTRLYTTLSPEDMNRDPVFSFNPGLPEQSRDHTATLRIDCGLGGDPSTSPATLITEQGWTFSLPNRSAPQTFGRRPGALRVETIAEEGNPLVLVDNAKDIEKSQSSCAVVTVDPALGLGLLAFIAARRRRRQS